MPIVVEVLSGSRRGHRAVLDKPVVMLGRHPDNDVVFDPVAEPLVSAFHAELRNVGGERWILRDRGSSNGTWVGGQRITEFAFEGRLEARLAAKGPIVALMPLQIVPAQAADAGTPPAGDDRPAAERAIDPLVVGPTADGAVKFAGGPVADHGSAPAAWDADRIGAEPAAPPPGRRGELPGSPPAPVPAVPSWQLPAAEPPGTAEGVRAAPRPGTTMRIRTAVGEAVRRSSRRFWAALAVLSVLLAGAGVLVALLATGRIPLGPAAPAGAPRRAEPAAPRPADARPAASPGEAAAPLSAKQVIDRNQDATFLFGTLVGNRGDGFCTGFALTGRVLATNAHCVAEMRRIWEMLGEGKGVYAFQNGHAGVKHRVQFAMMHPDYREEESDAIYPDVGLAFIDGPAAARVRLAGKERAALLQAGDRVYLLGFPDPLNNIESPLATVTEGIVGRLTDLGRRRADPADAVLIQHSAYTVKGTSGSPLFDENGEVVGVNAGYYRRETEQQRLDPVTGRVRGEMVTQDLQSYAIAMRVDLLHDLLRLANERLGTAQP